MSNAVLERLAVLPGVSDAIATLAERVSRSVVLVRNGAGAGSGVIWRRDGTIMTNHHVVPHGPAEVVLADGRRLVGRVIARDERADLAALQVAATDLPAATIGDSRTLRTGELVFAIGNPLGLRNTIVAGIVSRSGRLPTYDGAGRELVEANLYVYPGNSGGALVNARGEVIGLPAMVIGQGRALAVPAHLAEALLAERTVPFGSWFGFHGIWSPLPVPLSEWPEAHGLLLLGVAAGSPAEEAGFYPGDIVLGPAGAVITSEADFRAKLATLPAGVPVRLAVVRGGHWLEKTVTPRIRLY